MGLGLTGCKTHSGRGDQGPPEASSMLCGQSHTLPWFPGLVESHWIGTLLQKSSGQTRVDTHSPGTCLQQEAAVWEMRLGRWGSHPSPYPANLSRLGCGCSLALSACMCCTPTVCRGQSCPQRKPVN